MTMSPAKAEAWVSLSHGLAKLRASWPAGGWSWDGRLACVASAFGTQFEAEARAATAMGLPVEWTTASLLTAPERLKALATRFGDVRQGQLLFTGGALEGLFAFGLWWPWGNGQTISLRVGLADVDPSREPTPQFCELFKVSMT
jgi:hypothetical protein